MTICAIDFTISWDYIAGFMPEIWDGFFTSLKIFGIVLFCGFFIAIIIAALKAYGPKLVRSILGVYTWMFRGTPLVLQLMLVYYGFPYIGITFQEGIVVAVIIMTLSAAAYEAEIIRGGLISIDKGQFEASKALGMTFLQTLRRVVVPQTVRRVLAPSCSEVIILFKDTSLVTSIAVYDLLRRASGRAGYDFTIEPYIVALIFYLVFSSILVIVFNRLEKRYSVSL
ncbi:MAG: amino acid ABC transporter permease [Bacillota bacterium]|nr:amino acid ABC transporter permease [Bacillota bacterium]